jgi:hypothetical protein
MLVASKIVTSARRAPAREMGSSIGRGVAFSVIDLLSSLIYAVTFQVSRLHCAIARLLIAEP